MRESSTLEEKFEDFLSSFDIVPVSLKRLDCKGYIVPELFLVLVREDLKLDELYETVVHEFIHYEFPMFMEDEVEALTQRIKGRLWSILEAELGVPEWIKE